MTFQFFSYISLSSSRNFSSIGFLSNFLLQFPTEIRDFLLVTWSVETYQLPYWAKMFLLVSRFSSSIFFIGLRGFSPGFYLRFLLKFSFNKQLLCLIELTSKKKSHRNNVTFRAKATKAEVT